MMGIGERFMPRQDIASDSKGNTKADWISLLRYDYDLKLLGAHQAVVIRNTKTYLIREGKGKITGGYKGGDKVNSYAVNTW